MFIPISTDAPIYHRPWVTGSLIILNIAALAGVGMNGGFSYSVGGWDGWILEYGNGLHPLQWLTSNFVHFSPVHLIGNMLFLWTFGMVVEGKIGWWRFLLLYLGIGITGGMIIQTLMIGYDGCVIGAGGASLIVFGLIAVAMVWAPENEVDLLILFFHFLFLRASRIVQVRIYVLAGIYMLLELFILWNTPDPRHELQSVPFSSEMAHLLGAFLGFGAGVVMLKRNWVDCEKWDLFSVWKGEQRNSGEFVPWYERNNNSDCAMSEDMSESNVEPVDLEAKRQQRAHQAEQLNIFLSEGQPEEAFSAYQILKQSSPTFVLEETIHKTLANALYKSRLWNETIVLMEEYLGRFPRQSDAMRVKLAGILAEVKRRPRYALRVLEQISSGKLNEQFQRERRKIERAAERMIAEGVMEFEVPVE